MKHTPGPWKVHHHSHINEEQWLSVLNGAWDITHNGASNPAIVACSRYSAMSDEENLANALLIAAAPELLTACEYALEVIRENIETNSGVISEQISDCCDTLETAIQKAKGE